MVMVIVGGLDLTGFLSFLFFFFFFLHGLGVFMWMYIFLVHAVKI